MASDIVGFLGLAAAILVSAHAEGSILIGSGSCVEEFPSVLFPRLEHLLHCHLLVSLTEDLRQSSRPQNFLSQEEM